MSAFYSYYKEEDGEDIYYYFSTPYAIYSVYFKPNEYTDYVSDFPVLLEKSFGFGFFQFPHQPDAKISFDGNIKDTITNIICDFFASARNEIMILYHCDYADGKQGKRSKKFERWYHSSPAKEEIHKHEISLVVENNKGMQTTHYIGYLCLKSNPLSEMAQKEFDDFAADLVLQTK